MASVNFVFVACFGCRYRSVKEEESALRILLKGLAATRVALLPKSLQGEKNWSSDNNQIADVAEPVNIIACGDTPRHSSRDDGNGHWFARTQSLDMPGAQRPRISVVVD